ncbi:transposase IS3/IS911 family protein, partial [Anoxybacillus ayderensis]
MTRRFDKEFKIHAVKLVIEEGKAVAQTAKQLDISPKTLHKWVADYKKGAKHSFVGS